MLLLIKAQAVNIQDNRLDKTAQTKHDTQAGVRHHDIQNMVIKPVIVIRPKISKHSITEKAPRKCSRKIFGNPW